jgi:phage terminase large subunit-like protein
MGNVDIILNALLAAFPRRKDDDPIDISKEELLKILIANSQARRKGRYNCSTNYHFESY